MKKYSWIAALLLALAFTFIGCGAEPLPPPEETETFEDVALGDFNYHGGQPTNQAGWATDGHDEAEKKLGYKTEDFQTAKYLVLELKDDIKGGIDIIWGVSGPAADVAALGLDNAGWMSKKIVSDGGTPDPVATKKEGNILKILLPVALVRYDVYSSTDMELKLLIAYYSGVGNLVSKAYLQISSEPIPFVSATNIEVNAPNNPVLNRDIKLTATITPTGTSVQGITWQIVKEGTYYDILDEVAFAEKTTDIEDDNYDPPAKIGEEVTVLKDTIRVTVAKDALHYQEGDVVVRAILRGGKEDATGKKIDVVSTDFTIKVKTSPFDTIKLNGATELSDSNETGKWPIKTQLAANPPAKYIVIASFGSEKVGPNANFGELQWILQSSNVGWSQKSMCNSRITAPDDDGFVYFVFDLTKWGDDYDTLVTDSATESNYAQFVLNSWGLGDIGLYAAYIVNANITPTVPTGDGVEVQQFGETPNPSTLGNAKDDIGYITNKLPGGLSWIAK